MTFFTPLVMAFLVAVVVTLVVIAFAPQLGIVDDPSRRFHPARSHQHPVPRGGGIGVFVAIVAASLVFLPANSMLLWILAGAAMVVLIGIVDDKTDVPPLVRLAVNIAAAGAVIAGGASITFVTNPLGGIVDLMNPQLTLSLLGSTIVVPVVSWGLTLLWLVFMTNIISWSSGVDGQLAGFTPIAAATIGALSLRFGQDSNQWSVVILSVIIAGAYLGLLAFAAYPQRIMPGWSGGALAGFLLGTLAILSGAKLATAIIVLGVPVADALFVITRRIFTGHSPLSADAGHLHHRLLKFGWSRPQVALFYWLVAALLGFLVLHLNSQAKLYTIIMIGVLTGVLLVWLTFGRLSEPPDRDTG